eukprot:364743-Chlamydomonas_euryale.AAC.54
MDCVRLFSVRRRGGLRGSGVGRGGGLRPPVLAATQCDAARGKWRPHLTVQHVPEGGEEACDAAFGGALGQSFAENGGGAAGGRGARRSERRDDYAMMLLRQLRLWLLRRPRALGCPRADDSTMRLLLLLPRGDPGCMAPATAAAA